MIWRDRRRPRVRPVVATNQRRLLASFTLFLTTSNSPPMFRFWTVRLDACRQSLLCVTRQDQMFTDEVRNNPDLAHLARGRPRTVGGRPVGGGRGAAGRSAQPQQPEVDILKSLGDLGNNTKRRLQTLAAQFNAKMKAGQANANSGEPAAHGSERRGLLDGDDDGEEVALEFASRKDL
jgi:hypothetical protein